MACGSPKAVQEADVDFRATAPEPSAAPEIRLEKPNTFQLDNGLTVLVVENHKLPTVNASIYFDYPSLLEGDKAGLTSFFGSVMKAGTENYTKEEIDEELDYYGIDLYTGSRSVGFNSLKKQLPKAVEMMSEILFNPTFANQEELDKLKKQYITALEADSKSPDAIMSRVSNALVYGKDHPWGEYATEESYSNVNLDDLKNHYDTYFKPNIAYLTIVGDVTVDEARTIAQENFSNWKVGEVPDFEYPEPENLAQTEVAIVDLPSATQSNIYITNLENLKKANDDYFASVLGNYVLGGSSFSRLFLNLREDKGYTYGAYSNLGNDEEMKSRFNASAKVRNEVTDSSIMAFFEELNVITTNELTEKQVETATMEQTGRFALGLENPSTIASYARTILLEDLEEDFYTNYLRSLEAQTPATILASMKNYVKPDQARIVIVGKADDIADDVKALGYPVKFYDIWANEVADPTIKVDVGDVTAESILKKSIDAQGGMEKLSSLNSMTAEYSVTIAGAPNPAKAVMKAMLPNKSSLVMTLEGMGEITSQKFNGETGYVSQMGQQFPLEQAQIDEAKAKNPIVEELSLLNADVAVDNKVEVDGKQAYKLIADTASGKSERFYDAETGLLLKIITTAEVQGETVVTTQNFSDYTDYDGVKMPKTMKMEMMGQTVVFELKTVTFNSGVTEEDFK